MAGRPGGWSLTQIASSLGLAKSSTLSIITSLEAAGLICRSDNAYELDVGVLTPASGFLRGVDVVTMFKRQLASSPRLKDEIAHLALLVGLDVTYVARHLGRPPLPVTAAVGDRFPASITAVGTALLSELPDDELREIFRGYTFPRWTADSTQSFSALMRKIERTRELGYAIDDGETHPNVRAYGMVVHRVGNHVQDFAVSASVGSGADHAGRAAALDELRQVREAMEQGNDLR